MTGGNLTPKPKTLFRRFERFAVGAVMTVMALVLERLVMRAIRRGGDGPVEAPASTMQTSGAEVDLDP